jgi:hypothetical protein
VAESLGALIRPIKSISLTEGRVADRVAEAPRRVNSANQIHFGHPNLAPGAMEAPETVITRRRRHAITCITALLAGSRLTTIQSPITYYLHASKVPKRVFTTPNSIGISSGYQTLGRIVEQQASEVRKILKAIGA